MRAVQDVIRRTVAHGQSVATTIARDAFGITYSVMRAGRDLWRLRISFLAPKEEHAAALRRLHAIRLLLTEPKYYDGPRI